MTITIPNIIVLKSNLYVWLLNAIERKSNVDFDTLLIHCVFSGQWKLMIDSILIYLYLKTDGEILLEKCEYIYLLVFSSRKRRCIIKVSSQAILSYLEFTIKQKKTYIKLDFFSADKYFLTVSVFFTSINSTNEHTCFSVSDAAVRPCILFFYGKL